MAAGVVRCPEFPPGLTWLNSPRPLTVAGDLRGRVAVFDFWTYCCINCLHVLPVLRRIEERFAAQPVAVIGVHSAKFISEKDPENIRRAVARYGVMHPVVVDPEHDLWDRFAVRAWPTVVVVDAEGYIRETLSGEVEEDVLAAIVGAYLDEGREKGVLTGGPFAVTADPEPAASELRFPGRVHVDGDRLFIADSGHHRVLAADLDGRIGAIFGSGRPGARDGPAAEASFDDPQGLAAMDGRLFVADRGNHLLREVDLGSLQVRTVAGTGEKGRGAGALRPDRPREIPLRSPWALLRIGSQLLVAMAGSHQIWIFEPARGLLAPWAGSGREDHVDGALLEAAFAQPSGLARHGRFVLVADSEVSSIRAIDLEDEKVRTIVGRGLFDFGDRDGAPESVRLQHPLDVAAGGEALYVADTYNNKIKAIAYGSMETRTLFGDGSPAALHEPGGVAVAGSTLYIADTNNHRIRRGDTRTGSLETLDIKR